MQFPLLREDDLEGMDSRFLERRTLGSSGRSNVDGVFRLVVPSAEDPVVACVILDERRVSGSRMLTDARSLRWLWEREFELECELCSEPRFEPP